MENVREVMAEVGDWWEVRRVLGVPSSKRHEIKQQSSTEREKCLALGDYWVNTAPDAEAASPVRLVRPRPDHFSAGRWSRSQTAEIV